MDPREELQAMRRMAELEARDRKPAEKKPSGWNMETLLQMAKPEFLTDNLEKAAYELGGTVTDKTGSPAAGFVTNVAAQAVPALYGSGIGQAVGQALGRRVMSSALKPDQFARQTGKGPRAVETMLEDGYNVSPGSVAAMRSRGAALEGQVDDLIKSSTETVSRNTVAKAGDDVISRAKTQVSPAADMKAAREVQDEFMSIYHPRMGATQDIPVQLAQELKKGTYKAIGDRGYGELATSSTEAQKALARALKEGIEAKIPQVGALNKKHGDLINASRMASNRASLADNSNLGGLATLASNPVAGAVFAADRSSLFKSLLARALYKGGRPGGLAAGAGLGASTATEE